MSDELLEHTRRICMAFPEVSERLSHGAPTWFIRQRTTFATLWADGHHNDDFPHLWCAAPAGDQRSLIADNPTMIFRPPYVGGRGWLGVRLDGTIDWSYLARLCEDAYRTVAPKNLAAKLDGPHTAR